MTFSRKKLADWLGRIATGRLGRHCLAVGRNGEKAASDFLENAGYDILARNYRAPHGIGELDIVARDAAGCLCFVEVKTRRQTPGRPSALRPLSAVDDAKQRRLRRAARRWILAMGTPEKPRHRFDVVEVWSHGVTPVRIVHWPYAFPAAAPPGERP